MALTIDQAEAFHKEIHARIKANRDRASQGKTSYTQTAQNLGQMPADFTGYINEITALAAANPNNTVLQFYKQSADMQVSAFNALKTAIDSIVAAINAAEAE